MFVSRAVADAAIRAVETVDEGLGRIARAIERAGGALLVLAGDYCGQFLMPGRYPVGVVTGALGAPYLIYLIIRVNRSGGSL